MGYNVYIYLNIQSITQENLIRITADIFPERKLKYEKIGKFTRSLTKSLVRTT